MPYRSKRELPASVRSALKNVPHAQEIYKEAFNSAFKTYAASPLRKQGRNREETAHMVAWNAVKKKYEKGEDEKWHPKLRL